MLLIKRTSAAQRPFPGRRSKAKEFVQLFSNVRRPGLVAYGTWLPMAAVHCAAMTEVLLAGWKMARAEG